MEESDETLVEAALEGDARAFARLVDRHYAAIHRTAWRCCGDRTDAEDIAQEVCVRLARSLAGFERRSAFSTWLTGITLNAARDVLRARKRREAGLKAAATAFAADPWPPPSGPDEELWTAVRALPERQRDAVLLVHAEGLSHAEAARALGCAEATVSWHLFAARRQLKKRLVGSSA